MSSFYKALHLNATTHWGVYGAGKGWGIHFTSTSDPHNGCPWLYAAAELPDCPIAKSAQFIVTKLDQYQQRWDKRPISSDVIRQMKLQNGTMEVDHDWFVYDTGFPLRHRGYYNFAASEWNSASVLESSTGFIYNQMTPPNGTVTTVWMAGRQWKHLTATSDTSARYEVLQSTDIFGLVPCSITKAGQATVLHDEITAYREQIPLL